jgi:Leucine-rich repeat (LRR) protein
MGLVEIFTLHLAPAIAKGILKIWLKDSSLTKDISSSLVDIIAYKTKDVFAQRAAKRKFEEIGERVVENLLPIFEYEGRSLSESEHILVASKASDTLDKSVLDMGVLAELDLDPSNLARHLMYLHPDATRDFGEKQTELYKRIISEACQYIVDIASQLPDFNERNFSEVLKREKSLITRADQILEEVHRIRESILQESPDSEAIYFETEYRRAVIRNLDRLELFGADVPTSSRRYRLSVAYVTLSVKRQMAELSESPSHEQNLVIFNAGDVKEESESVTVLVKEALTETKRMLLMGTAGSGKTTLLQWIAVRSASQSFDGQLTSWNGTIPFFIRLRQCVESGLPTPEKFSSLVAPTIAGTQPNRWVHDQLRSGRAIVLVDGFDEVTDSQRFEVTEWLMDLVNTYPQARYIVSSRPHVIEEDWKDQLQIDDAELQPMDLPDIGVFIDHWHDAVRKELHDEEEKDELEICAESLKEIVQKNLPIRTLATNPLLCAMLCALNRGRYRQLPSDRIELYEACCNMLLDRRDIERRVLLRDYPQLSYRKKLVLLRDLAYWLLKNGWSMVAKQRVLERLDRRLKNLQGIPQSTTSKDILRLFIDRSGMIREPVAGQIDFTHLTFQEFLAAQEALDEGDIGVLVKHAHNTQWQGIIILTAGLASKRVREELIDGILSRGDNELQNRHRLHFLAVACLEASVELGSDVKMKVENRLSKLVPPTGITEATALASAGEMVTPYLRYNSDFDASVAVACIRTLSLIGDEDALITLQEYNKDSRQAVTDELLRAWDFFDQETYARKVLSAWTSLPISGPTFLERIQFKRIGYLTNLDALNLSNCLKIQDLTFLENLTRLASLDLSNCQKISNLIPLAKLTNLISLNLRNCLLVNDLDPLQDLINLNFLNLSDCWQVINLSPLSKMMNLRTLNLRNCHLVSDLSPLEDLVNLTLLDLSGCQQIDTLNTIVNLINITSLCIANCWKISDLNPLSNLDGLNSLNLSACEQLIDLNPLTNLTNLTSLNLSGCREIRDLRPLANLTNLTSLDLSFCKQITDLRSLTDLTNLTSLNLSGCQALNDLRPLTGLTNLKSLNLSGCRQINRLNPLSNLVNLNSLNLSSLEGSIDLNPLKSMINLQEIRLIGLQEQVDIPPEIKNHAKIHF